MKKLILVPVIFILASCSILFQEEAAKSERPSKELISKVSFQSVMTAVIRPKCVSCHGNSGGVNLESYQSARQFLDQIKRSTLLEKRMPKAPFPPLTQEETLLLEAWVEAGGPDSPLSGGASEPAPPDKPLEATYESIRSQIIEPKCIVCHKPGGKADNIPLLTKEDLLNSPLEIVIPGNVEESTIMIVVQEGARKFMPPKKTGITALTQAQIAILAQWISNGAKD